MPNFNYVYFFFLFAAFVFGVAGIILLVGKYFAKKKALPADLKKNKYDYSLLPSERLIPVLSASKGQVSNWGYELLKPELLHKYSKGMESIVFVMDTAGLFDHDDLVGNCLPEYNRDFTDSADNIDHDGHGTHCAGIIAAVDNQHGVIGIAPEAHLVAIKVLNDEGMGMYAWIIKAIRYVADLNCGPFRKFISMSLSGSQHSDALEEAIDYAASKNVFIFAAAGNSGFEEGVNSMGYPARYKNVISVSAATEDTVSHFSSGGAQLKLTAPGSHIFSTHVNGGYIHMSGSSQAAPAALGIGILIVGAHPWIKNQAELSAFMVLHATDWYKEGFDNRTGYGMPIADKYLPQETQEVQAAVIFAETFEAKDIQKMRETTILKIAEKVDVPAKRSYRKAKNAALVIEKLGV